MNPESAITSALEPASSAAGDVALLFWWMAGGAAVIWLVVIGLAVYATATGAHEGNRRLAGGIIAAGAVLPTLVLGGLLAGGLAMIPEITRQPPADALRITVVGEQWWWRVYYDLPDGRRVEVANEVHLPVGETVGFRLLASDVIHSFWIPPLGGKMDMIPGRENHLTMTADQTGVFRGACAEYCGTSHAKMAFFAVVEARAEFDQWIARQASVATSPDSPAARRGMAAFEENGCGACHTIRGTYADGTLGPDLTHVGSRLSIAAAELPNDEESFRYWLAETAAIKPGVYMPHFDMLPAQSLDDMAAYLESLK